jgi:hypothetical protein
MPSAAAASKENVREDFLDEDPEIPSQRYVLLSFISPENVLPKKDHYFFQNFLKYYEVQWRTKKLEEHLAGYVNSINKSLETISTALETAGHIDSANDVKKNMVTVDSVVAAFQEHVKKNTKEIQTVTIENEYKDFLYTYEKKLENEFHAANEFRTTVRGLKIRGSFGTIEEAKAKAKKLQKVDDIHNIALGEVGKWLPWDPSSDQFSSQEYAEDQLNQLMQRYRENEDNRNQMFREAKMKALPVEDVKKDVFEPMFGGDDLAIARKTEETAVATDAPATTEESAPVPAATTEETDATA